MSQSDMQSRRESQAASDPASTFLERGYVVAPAEKMDGLLRIQAAIAEFAADYLGLPKPANPQHFLDHIGQHVTPETLNEFRLSIISKLMALDWFREAYFSAAENLVTDLVGNELAMQRNIGLSVQLPQDTSSLLPVHSDVWSENSPFEVVLWIPMVDVYDTKSMYILPLEADQRWRQRLHEFADKGQEALYEAIKDEVECVNVKFGEVALFTHSIMHGNRLNQEPTARWSMNVRFKGLFTPYSDKRLGEYFVPHRIRPVTRIGMKFGMPGGFKE